MCRCICANVPARGDLDAMTADVAFFNQEGWMVSKLLINIEFANGWFLFWDFTIKVFYI